MSNTAGAGCSNPIRLIGKIGFASYLRGNCNLKEIKLLFLFIVARNGGLTEYRGKQPF